MKQLCSLPRKPARKWLRQSKKESYKDLEKDVPTPVGWLLEEKIAVCFAFRISLKM